MKEFKENFEEGLTKGLRRFKTNPRNNQALLECHNWEPTEKGLKPREDLEGLTIVTLAGDIDESISLSDIFWFSDDCFPTDRGEPPVVPKPRIELVCVGATSVTWNTAASAKTITTPGAGGTNSVQVLVTSGSGTTPYIWSVVGTGFSLLEEGIQTDNFANTLYADDTACGTAVITVVDDCGFTTTGYVRASVGVWVATGITTCVKPGEGTLSGGFWHVYVDQYYLKIKTTRLESCGLGNCTVGFTNTCDSMCWTNNCQARCATCATTYGSDDPCTPCVENMRPTFDLQLFPCYLDILCWDSEYKAAECWCNQSIEVKEWVCS